MKILSNQQYTGLTKSQLKFINNIMENNEKKNSRKSHLDKKREEKLRQNLRRRKEQDKGRSSILKDKEKE